MPHVDRPGPHQTYRHPTLAVEERALGALAAGSLRVEMLYVGACGTDVHVVESDPATGYVRGSAPFSVGPQGRVLGHEGVGRVVAAGDGTEAIAPGALVTFESILRCHTCEPCRRGDFNQCDRSVLLGMERDGLFGTVVDVPAELAHDVSDLRRVDDGLKAAACIEPAACAFVACTLCALAPGDDVLVLGAGPIGAFAAMLARLAFGAASVHVVEPVPFRRELAGRWADRTWSVDEFFSDPPPRRFDVLFEASGDVAGIDRALHLLGPNARVAVLGRGGRPLAVGRVDHLITNNISIVGSRGHLCGAFASILRLVRAGRLRLQDVVTDVVEGLPALRDRLLDPTRIAERDCKVLARLGDV
jgi:D-xylulose reductase